MNEPSPPDASQQRGVVERGIGVLSEIGRSNMHWAKSPLASWAEAVRHGNTTSNNVPNTSNPDNKSPYQMANPGAASQIHLLRPFGCLTFTLVKTKDRNGKLNSVTSCDFLANYGLTPDGKINGYRLLNFRTLRLTTKFNVDFNVHVPALRYILCELVSSPQQLLVGHTIKKRFSNGTFTGTIVGHSTEDNTTFYHVDYDDGDSEQLDLPEVLRLITPIQADMTAHIPRSDARPVATILSRR